MENKVYEFSFNDFRLLSVHFELKADKEFKLTKNIEIQTNFSITHEFSPQKKDLRLFMKVEVCGEKLPFVVSAEAGGLFHFPHYRTEIPYSTMEKIAKINCAAIIFPYLREALADIVRRSGLPPLNLPPVNFVEFYNDHKVREKPTRKKLK
jgi:preprotein translocase subunit SecB